MATHSSILAWRIPWTEELLSLSPAPMVFPGTGSAHGTQLRHLDVQLLGINRLVEEGSAVFCLFLPHQS